MTTTAALELVGLTKMYGSVTAVDAIDLKIPAGSYCCLLGPSGCGKTSTLRMIAGHEQVSSGDILVGPKNVTDLPPAERNTAMMFQSYALFPHLSVLDNVAFALKMRGVDKPKRHAEPDDCSNSSTCRPTRRGCRDSSRAASSSAWHWPRADHLARILLLDEPLSALDPFLRCGCAPS